MQRLLGRRFLVLPIVVGLCIAVISPSQAATSAPRPATAGGSFVKRAPASLLDTRSGVGAPKVAVASHGTITVQLAGRGGIPGYGASSVMVTATAIQPVIQSTQPGYLTVYPTGSGRSPVQQVNFVPGGTTANLVVSRVSSAGRISIYNGSTGAVQVSADAVGSDVRDFAWAPAGVVDRYQGWPQSFSCASPTFCSALDGAGNAVIFNGISWSTPAVVDPNRAPIAESCPTSTFCAAIDSGGNALTFNGSVWSSPVSINDTAVDALSCASANFCVAVDTNGRTLIFNGSAWTAATPIHSGEGWLTSVSCRSATFCIAVAYSGNAYRYNGASWGKPTGIAAAGSWLTSVSCASATFCAAVDASGHALTYNGTSWTAPADIDGGAWLWSVSCASATFCVAVDTNGAAVRFTGGSWTAPVVIDPTLAQPDDPGRAFFVSCTSSSFCAALDVHGTAVRFNGASWTSPAAVDPAQGYLSSVSCPTRSFCAGRGHIGKRGHVQRDRVE